MRMLAKLNGEGMTIMLVTHDMKSAAKCSRILYIVDGNIKGELQLGKLAEDGKEFTENDIRARERKVGNWLEGLGW